MDSDNPILDIIESFVILAASAVPLWYFTRRIADRAAAKKVSPFWYQCLALACWPVGVIGAFVAASVVSHGMGRDRDANKAIILAATLGCGLVGAALAPGASYLLLRMRTARNLDYEEMQLPQQGPGEPGA